MASLPTTRPRNIVSARPAKTGSLDFRTVIVPLEGGEPVTVCATVCFAFWTDWGNLFAVYLIQNAGNKTVFLPIPPGKVLPVLPEGGIERVKPESIGKGARVLDGVAVLGPYGGEYVSLRDSTWFCGEESAFYYTGRATAMMSDTSIVQIYSLQWNPQ